ncbi:pimeloyl-ACP methyl ester esterase BioH [Aliiglaciecola litoralis]|uniref:Pimeloyl-[acyl-carrier protein] methyl ester esterase n=1 Tax=Aliiglaciecola litoralis TaxID=582857 RepID=A0ABP3WPW2_9ALTE
MTTSLFTESRGQGPHLVLLHGWGLNSGVWESIIEQLEDHFRITFIDLPGYGRNASVLPSHYDLDSITSMVAECLPNKCSLLGWSMGGLVAQKIACEHATNIEKLVLLATSPKFSQDEDWPGIKPNVLNTFEQQLEHNYTKTLDRFMAIQALGSATAKQDIKFIRDFIQHYPMPDAEALRAGLRILADTDLRTRISEIQCETHRWYGRLDSLVPVKATNSIATLQPNSQTHIFAHASHAPFISHPEEFIAQLLSLFSTDIKV